MKEGLVMAKNPQQNAGGPGHQGGGATERFGSSRGQGEGPGQSATRLPEAGGGGSRWAEEGSGGWSASAVGDRLHDVGSSAGEMISEHPMMSLLAGFGLGFGLGFAVGMLLAPREEPQWSSRSMADAFWGLSHSLRQLPQATADYVSSALHRR
jgi:hypothetical protein